LSAEHGASGAFGIKVVRLAMPVAQPAIGTARLVDGMARRAEEARQPTPYEPATPKARTAPSDRAQAASSR
jgi:hypothetical protein